MYRLRRHLPRAKEMAAEEAEAVMAALRVAPPVLVPEQGGQEESVVTVLAMDLRVVLAVQALTVQVTALAEAEVPVAAEVAAEVHAPAGRVTAVPVVTVVAVVQARRERFISAFIIKWGDEHGELLHDKSRKHRHEYYCRGKQGRTARDPAVGKL